VRRLLPALALTAIALLGAAGTADAGPPPADTTPPSIHFLRPREGVHVPRFSPPVRQWFCWGDEDGGSCEASTYDTDTVGPRTLTVVARDAAGNEATATIHFEVVDARCDGRTVDVYLPDGDQPTDGDDVIFGTNGLQGPGPWAAIDAGRGDDAVCAYAAGSVVHAGPGDDFVKVNGRAYGGGGDDRLLGMGLHDRLSGGRGRDILSGTYGVDRLDGGAGSDWLDGGARSDLCIRPASGADVFTSCERR
jgi:Ca2+-binding RTX toxin-like protein